MKKQSIWLWIFKMLCGHFRTACEPILRCVHRHSSFVVRTVFFIGSISFEYLHSVNRKPNTDPHTYTCYAVWNIQLPWPRLVFFRRLSVFDARNKINRSYLPTKNEQHDMSLLVVQGFIVRSNLVY